MNPTRSVVLALVAGLTLTLLGPGQPAAGRVELRPGAAGIGDPYFPLDGNGGIDVLSYDVRDRYRFQERRLSGRTTLRLRATQSVSRFNLDFLLPVSRVRVEGRRVRFGQRRAHELTIHRRLRAGRTVTVLVVYDGRPQRLGYAGERNWLASDREVVAMNQPHMAPWWFPANDHPLDKARMRIRITVPRTETVVANGQRVSRRVHRRLATTTWRVTEPIAPYLAFFAAGRFRVAQGTRHGLPWYVAVSRLLPTAAQPAAMATMRRSPAVVEWLEARLGPYPFSSTGGLVTSLDPGFALENQTRPTYPAWGATPLTVVHELAHQWFGDSVAVRGWQDIWLNEGPATFLEHHYTERHGGQSARDWLRSTYDGIAAADAFWHHEVADPCPAHRDCLTRIFAPFVYDRGAMALQALRDVIGEDDFWRLLRRWVTDLEHGNGSTGEFEALAEEVSGRQLDGFFDAWLHSASKPPEEYLGRDAP